MTVLGDEERRAAARALWARGDYATVGDLVAGAGPALCERVGVAGLDVLDVGTGTGNTALASARAGGRVTGVDLTPELLAVARRRADAAGLQVEWREADALSLPCPDAAFDRVLSTFAVMFAPDPRRAASELVRVCRPGGVIGVQLDARQRVRAPRHGSRGVPAGPAAQGSGPAGLGRAGGGARLLRRLAGPAVVRRGSGRGVVPQR
ncbi:MAG: class I SAM-dependent methyltransferase [Actinomycetota bacterium]|nr:class I SAM-dependent methyltransferase [Actinomycetota bacterium]